MAQLTLELGSEAHTTSSGSVRATIGGLPFHSTDIAHAERKGDGYTLFIVDLLPGTRIEVLARGVSGPRGCYRDHLYLIIEVTKCVEKWYMLAAGPNERRLEGHFKIIYANQEAIHYLGLQQHVHKRNRKKIMATMTVPTLGKKYHLAETTLRDAINRKAFPAEKMGRDHIIDDETAEFQAWLEEHHNQSRVIGERRRAVPLLALGEFAANHGIALSHRRDGYDIEKILMVMLQITEKEGNNPAFARAAVKGEIERLLQGKVALSVIGQYVDLFYDTVLGEPLQQHLLRFLQRERLMKAAYVQAYRETKQELSPTNERE